MIQSHSVGTSESIGGFKSAPLFSIGVTTYNRPELLKQTLSSITNQTFSDFEVLVGNDYVKEPVTKENVDICDSRIRFINRLENLGEARNMNSLLNMARGRYFIWQNDDDLFGPDFLEKVRIALLKFKFPLCVFTSYEFIYGDSFPNIIKTLSKEAQSFSGRQFLKMYWSGKIKAIGCNGVYNKEYLKQIGGVECLADTHRPLYSEHLLLVRAGLLEQIIYIDEPLVKYRIHKDAWGCSTKEFLLYKQAGENLLRESIIVFSNQKLREDFSSNIKSVLKFVVINLLDKLRSQDRLFSRLGTLPFFFSLKKQFKLLEGSILYWSAVFGWCMTGVRLIWLLCTKFNFKAAMSNILFK